MNETIVLTHENLHALGTRNGVGWNRKQLALLGVKWPPHKGWLSNLIGTEINAGVYQALMMLRNDKQNAYKSKQMAKERNSVHMSKTQQDALLQRMEQKLIKWRYDEKEKRRKWLAKKPNKTTNEYKPKIFSSCHRAKDWYGF
jgi:hypothetical protein